MTEKHLEERDLRELEDEGFVLGCIFLSAGLIVAMIAFWAIGAFVWTVTGLGFGHGA